MEEKSPVVFITGATGLLGKMYVEYFLSNNYQVIFTSSQMSKIEKMYDMFKNHKKKLIGCYVDFSTETYIDVINEFLIHHNLMPEYLINNARSLDHLKIEDYRKVKKEQWLGEYYLEVIVPYQLAMFFANKKNNKLLSIVNIASMYGIIPPNPELYDNPLSESVIHYGVSKAALIQLTKELAIRLADQNIRVNSIAYGGVKGRASQVFQQKYAKLCPMRKMLDKDDIVGHVAFLCSAMSNGMTGHNMVVDGGFSVW